MLLHNGLKLNNRYHIEELLGQGGFGAVYQAYDGKLDIMVAVKESRDMSADAIRQFEREALILARLRHPFLPRVSDHFTIAGLGQYLVMDFVKGQNLHQLHVNYGKPTTGQAVAIINQICLALTYLHQQTPPIIHRDIKPANIIVNQLGQAILVDFGIAKYFGTHLSTSTGAKGRTPGYAPPEQYGNGHTDTRTDVYALGATLYMLLTGQHPPDAIDRFVNSIPLLPLSQLNPMVPQQLSQVVCRAMSLKMEARYQTVEAFQQALNHTISNKLDLHSRRKIIPGHISRQPVKKPYMVSPNDKNSWQWRLILLFLNIVLIMIIICGGLISLWQISGYNDDFLSASLMNDPTATAVNYKSLQSAELTISEPSTNTPPPIEPTMTAIAPPTSIVTVIVIATATSVPPSTNTPIPATDTPIPSMTPTATYFPSPTIMQTRLPHPTPNYQFSQQAITIGSHPSNIQFFGTLQDQIGQSVNGYSILLDNGYFQVLSHPTGPSQWLSDNPDGYWNVRLYNPADAQGTWTATVVMYQCNFQHGFDAQCKDYAKLSEGIQIEIKPPQLAVVKIDWTCRWRCNRGLYMVRPTSTSSPIPSRTFTPWPTNTPLPSPPTSTVTPWPTPSYTPSPTYTPEHYLITPISPLPTPDGY